MKQTVRSSIRTFSWLILILPALTSCGKRPVRLIDKVKQIPISGGHDTVYMERSAFWDRGAGIARSDSNRQVLTFQPPPGQTAYVTLENMGRVPLKRDTFQSVIHEAAELYLRTGTLDSNLQLHIEYADYRIPATDVVLYIRNRDSVYREILFAGVAAASRP